MGHKPGVDYVVKEGNGTKTPGKEFDLTTTIYAWLEPVPTMNCSAAIHNWSVKEIKFPPGGIITADWKPEGNGEALLLNTSNVTSEAITFDWICKNTAAGFTGDVNVTIELPGFADVTFEMEKKCFPHIAPSPEPPTGWSPAAIFFFTVFVLTMVFCIVGCGVNYVQRGKTGLEIVPGATTFAECMGKVFRQPRYTPQMDYDAPVGGPTERFGTSYQTDL
jgi:hypothetical protein